MSLDPLNVGRLKTWRKLSNRFSLGLFLVDDERDFILRMQITLDALFQQVDRKYNPYISHF